MRFTTIIVSVFAAIAIAAPQDVTIEGTGVGEIQEVTEAIEFAMSPMADCSLRKCAKVAGAAVCIAAAIAAKKPQNLVRCVNGGAGAICPCAGCINKLNGFLVEHHVCH